MDRGKGAQMGKQVWLVGVLARVIFQMGALSDNLTDR